MKQDFFFKKSQHEFWVQIHCGLIYSNDYCQIEACSLVVSDLCSENKGSPARVRLLTMCKGKLSAVIARLMSMCL